MRQSLAQMTGAISGTSPVISVALVTILALLLTLFPSLDYVPPFLSTTSNDNINNSTATVFVEKQEKVVTPVVAHCITGQIRTMDHPMIWQNFRDHVLNRIGAPSHVFFVIDTNTSSTMELYQPKRVHIVPMVESQYERWSLCMKMILEVEATENVQYSHVIINRPDQMVLQDLPSVDTFPNHSVWVKPYAEEMDSYSATMLVGDDTALQAWESHPVHGKMALSDLFLVIPRYAAPQYVQAVVDKDCGNHTAEDCCGSWAGHLECRIRCALAAQSIPYVYQNFQLRILRYHTRKYCSFCGRKGKDYNSICI
jgi:hypothetical protein